MYVIHDHKVAAEGILQQHFKVDETSLAVAKLILSVSTMVEQAVQGTALFTATPTGATNPGSVSITSLSIANALQMNADGLTVEAGSVAVSLLDGVIVVGFAYTDDLGTHSFTRSITITDAPDIAITTVGSLDISLLRVGDTIEDAWIVGTYPDYSGNTVSETLIYRVDGSIVSNTYVLATDDNMAQVEVTLSAAGATDLTYFSNTGMIEDFTFVTTDVSWIVPAGISGAPDAFVIGDWNIVDDATNNDATINILTLPADNGNAITGIDFRVNGGAWTSLGGLIVGAYALSGFTDNTVSSVELRSSNSIGNSGISDTKVVTTTGVPAAFTIGMWSIVDDETGGDATLSISALPVNNGSAITDIEINIDAGGWSSLGVATTGDVALDNLFTDDVSSDVNIRAVNANGTSATSDTKAVTTTTVVTGTDISFVGAISGANIAGASIVLDITSLSVADGDFAVIYMATGENNTSGAVGIGVNEGETGWTKETAQYGNDNRNITGRLAYKFFGPSPEDTITLDASVGSNHVNTATIRVYRNVDPAGAFDGSIVFLTQANGGVPFVSDITPINTGSVAVNFCAGTDTNPVDLATAGPAGWDNFAVVNDAAVYACQLASSDVFGWTTGLISGGAYASAVAGATEARVGATFVLNKAP